MVEVDPQSPHDDVPYLLYSAVGDSLQEPDAGPLKILRVDTVVDDVLGIDNSVPERRPPLRTRIPFLFLTRSRTSVLASRLSEIDLALLSEGIW